MTWAAIAIGLAALVALVWMSARQGRLAERSERDRQIAEERGNDSQISAQPFADRPLGRMRRKDK